MTLRLAPMFAVLGIATSVGGLAGCASSNAGNVYSRAEARQAQVVKFGTVEASRPSEAMPAAAPMADLRTVLFIMFSLLVHFTTLRRRSYA